MPIYRRCLKCKTDMEPQEARTCPACQSTLANPHYMRDYWRKRRADPEVWAKEKARLKGYQRAKPDDERQRYGREVMQRWRNVPENAAKLAARNRAVGEDVLAHYGGVCACCAEHRYEFLSIDHPNNDGAAHRRDVGPNFRRWLKRQGFPPGYRVLCMNCNFARGRFGYCPHEREQS
jgi:hypothetical protein